MIPDALPLNENLLRNKLQSDPTHWETRRRLAHALYDKSAFREAADTIWNAEHIPSNDVDIAFAARILSKAEPRKAIRLLTAVLELNRGKPIQNMGMANALLHHGMVLQALRFYGAALEADPSLANPDLEHFALWTDDEMTLWADFTNRRPKLGELPWMARDPKEALKLTSHISYHSTPIHVPMLAAVPSEQLRNDFYLQEAAKNAKITPPPAVTIPIDRVDPKYRRFDEKYGATVVHSSDAVPLDAADNLPTPPSRIPVALTAQPNNVPNSVPRAPTAPVMPPPIATKPLVPAAVPTRALLIPGGKPNTIPAVNQPSATNPAMKTWAEGVTPKK